MKIIIAGAGRIGGSIAESLVAEGHDITVIERDRETVDAISGSIDAICIEGNAANPGTLADAGASEADLVLAVTEKDEINMLCGVAALKLGAAKVVARVREPEYVRADAFLRSTFGLSLIVNPEYECATEIARILRFPGASRVRSFSGGKMEIAEHTVRDGESLSGVKLRDLKQIAKAKVLVSLVERDGSAFIPNGDFELSEGDRLSLAGADRELRKFFAACRAYDREVRDVIILGGSRTAVYLARLLGDCGINSAIIESSRERCDVISDYLPRSCRVICGDGTRSEVLTEEGISRTDAFVALTGDDGDNIITSVYAKNCGAGKTVTKVNHEHFSLVVDNSGIDCIIVPKNIVANQITGYVRAIGNSAGNSTETLYKLAGGKAEALELAVGNEADITGIALKNLPLNKDILIAGIIRDGKSIVPDGDTAIEAGDHLVIVARADTIRDLEDIIAR